MGLRPTSSKSKPGAQSEQAAMAQLMAQELSKLGLEQTALPEAAPEPVPEPAPAAVLPRSQDAARAAEAEKRSGGCCGC